MKSNAILSVVTPKRKGRGGARPKSIEDHKRDGTYRADRHGQRAKRQKAGKLKVIPLPPAPSYYTPEQREIYNEFKACIDDDQITTQKDVRAFELMVQSYMLIRAAWKELFKDALAGKKTEGECLTYKQDTKDGYIIKRRAEVDTIEKNHKICAYHFSRFGMSPADRLKMDGGNDGDASQGSGQKRDGLEEFEE